MRILPVLIAGFFGLISAAAQPTDPPSVSATDSVFDYIRKNKDRAITQAMIIDRDTIPLVVLDEVLLIATPSFNSDEARRRYFLLKRKVMKVYPYAVLAGTQLDTLNARLSRIKRKRDRKKYVREFQDYLEQSFEPELRKLTRTEGQILCKLVFRETSRTPYDLLKEYRSGWTAFWYGATASYYDIDLKKPYQPDLDDEDRLIENILLRAFQQDLLEERVKADIPTPKL